MNLTLGPGPSLIWRDIHRKDSDHPVARDVAEQALAFLFEPVVLLSSLRLGDIFRLLDTCPALKEVFRRSWAVELCEEARKGSVPPSRDDDPIVAEIEYLELYWSWTLDTASKTYRSVHQLDFHGVGPVLAEDAPTYNVKAGDRIRWSLSLTPVRELVDLPLRLREEFSISEDDIDAKAYTEVVATGRCPEVLLGQIIQGVLDEIAFHGGPSEQAEFSDELKARVDEVKAGTARLAPAGDIFGADDPARFAAVFEALGGVLLADVRRAIRQMEDDEPAGPFFERTFNARVLVKPQFWGRRGREFRKAFRAAGR